MTRQLDELVDELRRIANRADTSNLIIDNHNVLREAADAIDSLRSQPAGGRDVQDAERYRWLKANEFDSRPADAPFICIRSAHGSFSRWTGDSADEQVDAHRMEQKP